MAGAAIFTFEMWLALIFIRNAAGAILFIS
jgi:hypothetical protein